jgi:hypothetical protein
MTTKLKYIGKHLPIGIYEIQNNPKPLLDTGDWVLYEEDKSQKVTKTDLMKLDLKALKKWAKDNDLNVTEKDKDKIIAELLKELKK